MFDDDVRQLLESQGPWNIRVDEILGQVYFDNGTNFLEFEPQVEEYLGHAHGIEWNVQRYKKITL